ncbi:hypothetical protein MDAP_001508 [Mitosporidium daphniae]
MMLHSVLLSILLGFSFSFLPCPLKAKNVGKANECVEDDEAFQYRNFISKLDYPLDCARSPLSVGSCLNLKNPYNHDKISSLFVNMVVMNSRFISSKLPAAPLILIPWGFPFSSFVIKSYDIPMKNATLSLTSVSNPNIRDNEFHLINEAITFSGSGVLLYLIPFTFSGSTSISLLSKICIPTKNNISNIYNSRLEFIYMHIFLKSAVVELESEFLNALFKYPLRFGMEIFRLVVNIILLIGSKFFAIWANCSFILKGKRAFLKEDGKGIPHCPLFKH